MDIKVEQALNNIMTTLTVLEKAIKGLTPNTLELLLSINFPLRTLEGNLVELIRLQVNEAL